MKKTFVFCLLIFLSIAVTAQVPQALKYKGIVKSEWDTPVSNETVSLRFTVLQDNIEIYQEIQYTKTAKF